MNANRARQTFEQLLATYGPQAWWPADSPFEVMVGALLTQNTNWRNVEKAIANLKGSDMLDARRILDCERERLEELIRPAGFFRQKAERLQILCAFYLAHGGEAGLAKRSLKELRHELLALKGVGPETADSILLYALHLPIFVVDAYTKRIFGRLGLLDETATYHAVQQWFEEKLEPETETFQEYHALIVEHAKRFCRVKPLCTDCPLCHDCRQGSSGNPSPFPPESAHC